VETRLTDTFAFLREKLWQRYQIPVDAPMIFMAPNPFFQPYPKDPLSKFPEATEPVIIWEKTRWGDSPPTGRLTPEPNDEAGDIICQFTGGVSGLRPRAQAPIDNPDIGAVPGPIEEEDGAAFQLTLADSQGEREGGSSDPFRSSC
jgi:hypothetical protein